ncbi:MAG: FGGY-family carbohydrate kinase [Geminicoccales bacterium]
MRYTANKMDGLYLGIDIGTSGCRVAAIGDDAQPRGQNAVPMPAPMRNGAMIEQDPAVWWRAVSQALKGLLDKLDRRAVRAIAVDGTSGTLLLCNAKGEALGPGLMYNDARAIAEADLVAKLAPSASGALGPSSALAKLLHLTADDRFGLAAHALHQADWIAARLSGRLGLSDHNNALKLGYDVIADRWPDWFDGLDLPRHLLPEILPPGREIGPIDNAQATTFGLPSSTRIVSGTTDGVAAFLATGASELGDAVTSLGSTLVVKQLADRPLFDPASGVYSHRLGDLWLPGGASNSGGAALAQFFSPATIEQLSAGMRPEQPTDLDYYPLPDTGERFPINDPKKVSITEPRPSNDTLFLQGLMEGIASIEVQAYKKLQTLGAPLLRSVRTVGGGAVNQPWTKIREAALGVEIMTPETIEAAFGAARLARIALLHEGTTT